MDSPDETIESWKKQIEKETNKDMLKCILQDIKVELSDMEDWTHQYEDLIDDIENKLEGEKTK